MDFGNDFIRRQVDKIGKAQVQRALNLWWRLALNMFGPPVTGNMNHYIRLGLKYRTNEERRMIFPPGPAAAFHSKRPLDLRVD